MAWFERNVLAFAKQKLVTQVLLTVQYLGFYCSVSRAKDLEFRVRSFEFRFNVSDL